MEITEKPEGKSTSETVAEIVNALKPDFVFVRKRERWGEGVERGRGGAGGESERKNEWERE